jgi:hypothetical protein
MRIQVNINLTRWRMPQSPGECRIFHYDGAADSPARTKHGSTRAATSRVSGETRRRQESGSGHLEPHRPPRGRRRCSPRLGASNSLPPLFKAHTMATRHRAISAPVLIHPTISDEDPKGKLTAKMISRLKTTSCRTMRSAAASTNPKHLTSTAYIYPRYTSARTSPTAAHLRALRRLSTWSSTGATGPVPGASRCGDFSRRLGEPPSCLLRKASMSSEPGLWQCRQVRVA